MGPIATSPTSPNPSEMAVLSPSTEAVPSPREIIKGTVIGPVITPPESNATGIKFSDVKNDKIKIRR